MALTAQESETLLKLLELKKKRESRRKIRGYYPADGPLRRELYVKHMRFFAAGKKYRERAMLAANQIGKTEGVELYELTLHLTGQYPEWWEGRRFKQPIKAWCAGTTSQTVRDILQFKLLGPAEEMGTGMIPGDEIVDTKKKAGNVPDTVETILVKHYTKGRHDGTSRLVLKSYEQGRKAFEGDKQDVIALDEECPLDIYTECLTRTINTGGMVLLVFTPLQGISDTVLQFMPGGRVPEEGEGIRFCIQASWDDAPHLTEEAKREILESYPPHERDARSKGIPQLGSGKIYPVSEDDILITDIEIPEHFPVAYGFDVGWNATAALWGAWDRENDILYIWGEYKRGQAEPPVHAQAIKDRGDVNGVCDPAAMGRGQRDGSQLMVEYQDLGLHLEKSKNMVEGGLFAVYKRMVTGRLKVAKSCIRWLEEFRLYRRDKNGKVVPENDHLMDCMRYLVLSGADVARPLERRHKRNSVEKLMDKIRVSPGMWG